MNKLQSKYKLPIIKDLGMFKKNENYSIRHLILKCPECDCEFEVQNTTRNQQRTSCFECVKSTSVTKEHPRLYNIWKGMRSRVNSSDPRKAKSYKNKNIKVCAEWEDYHNFKNWALSNGYRDDLTIDRRDNDGNYEPSNCRWTGAIVQAANTRQIYNHNTSTYRGVSEYGANHFHSYITVNKKRISIGYYNTALEAAKARDTYIIDNDLEHTMNNVLKPGEQVEANKNKLIISTNKSGYRGVSFIKRLANTGKPWFTQITLNKDDRVFSKYASSAEEGAFLREHYIHSNPELINRLKLNFTYAEYEQLKQVYL